MQSTKRLALPLRVHQIWDGIARASSGNQGPVDFERLMEILTTAHKLPRDEVNRELELAVKDQLVMSEVIQTQKREEAEVYKLPDPEFSKGDHDWYCFHCHLGGGGPAVACEDCPRIFHLDCLTEDRKPQKYSFVCPPCHIMATLPSAESLNVNQKQLNALLQYSCTRFNEWVIPFMNSSDGGTWAVMSGRDAKEGWKYGYLVYFHIDLTQMLEKASSGKYTSLEEYQVDCETLIHGIGVYFGNDQLKGQAFPSVFHRQVMHDIQEIKLCHDCYRRSNEKDHAWWFCFPCTTPHEVVWAKQSGHPYWPAKVMKVEGSKYDVRYFGGNYERGMIDVKDIRPISTPLETLRVRRTAALNEALDELEKFQRIAKDPELVRVLPPTKGGGVNKKARKSNIVVRKSAPVQSASLAPAAPRGRKSAGAVLSNSSASSIPHRRDSASSSMPVSLFPDASRDPSKAVPDDTPPVLDAEDVSFLNTLQEVGVADSLNGDAYFSDKEQDESQGTVSEDAVSSSVNESSVSRNVYAQTSSGGLSGRREAIKECVAKHLASMKKRHAEEMSSLKKKQWCFYCESEAIYHCCWNTSYCSIECQQTHWAKDHKRLCRRKKAAN